MKETDNLGRLCVRCGKGEYQGWRWPQRILKCYHCGLFVTRFIHRPTKRGNCALCKGLPGNSPRADVKAKSPRSRRETGGKRQPLVGSER